MDYKFNLNLSLKIMHFSIVVVALGTMPVNAINMPNLESKYLIYPLVK